MAAPFFVQAAMNKPTPVINGPWPLRAFKIATAFVLGTPATLIWLPYMVPFALFGPFWLLRDVAKGRFNLTDLHLVGVSTAGTLGLVGFWLWVFDHPGRTVRMQRFVGVLWLAGAATLGSNLLVPNVDEMWRIATMVLCAVVTLLGLAMCLRPRTH
jgi:hypothetical protein